MESTIYYTTIAYQSILKKDNWKRGGNASTFIANNKDGKTIRVEVSQYGKTKKEAKQKLIKFLSGNGDTNIECVGKFQKNKP